MKKITISLMLIALTVMVAGAATYASLLDTETSNANTFSAGTLDLNIDGGNTNVVKFNVNNMVPGNQPHGSFTLANVGTVNGFLDLENVSVVNNENTCVEPETEAGDTTCGSSEGELGSVVNLRMWVDTNGDGWISSGENVFYNGKVSNLPSNFNLNEALNAGANRKIGVLLDWWSTADDNKAQGDSMTVNMTFELAQTSAQ